MRDSITGHSLFNDNKMTRGLDARPVILVESDSDQSMIGAHILDRKARCAPGFSRTATLLAAELHERAGDDWVIAVVDRDVDVPVARNVIVTDMYDLEAEALLLNRSAVVRYVYTHLVSERSFQTASPAQASWILDESIVLAATIGWARRHSHLDQLGVSMANLPINEIVKRGSPGDYTSSAVSLACQRARRPELASDLEDAVRSSLSADAKRLDICNGHDLLSALAVFVKPISGHRPNGRDFARGFHALIDCSAFALLSVFNPLRDWFKRLTSEELWDCLSPVH